MPIPYDASRAALLAPESRQTLFWPGITPTPAQLAAEAARLAYVRTEEGAGEMQRLCGALQLVGYGDVRVFRSEGTGAYAFGALRAADGAALLAFRGTQPDSLSDLGTDADARPVPWGRGPGLVHSGFQRAYESLHPGIDTWLRGEAAGRSQLLLCGHSLGAALACLAASLYRPRLLFTLGAPRVGDADFVQGLAGVESMRVVNCCDLVTRLPPTALGYAHAAPLTYITCDGKTRLNPDRAFIDEDREQGRRRHLAQFAWRVGTVPVRDLADHAPVNYARAFFP